ncbi:MAG: host attachment protein [Campylobacterales bacterium]|nr:host attachment protein [Campylobacterales bacterium]
MKFNGSILVLGDLGQLKAYRVGEVVGTDSQNSMQVSHVHHHGTQKRSTVLDLITDINYIDPRKKTEDLLSDQAGRFRSSIGEAHNRALERDRQTLQLISEDIKSLIEKESPDSWYLAFPKESHNELHAMLSEEIKKSLHKVVPSDLTKTAKEKLLSHFE